MPIVGSPEVNRYRNKVQFPVGVDKSGKPCIGFYAGRTHRIVPCPDCRLQPGVLNEIGNALCAFFAEKGIQPYSEETGRGLVRHIFLRRGAHSGQIMVCLVCTRAKLPSAEELCTRLKAQFAEITTILLNVNAKNTNVILGTETHTLYGPGILKTPCAVFRCSLARFPSIRSIPLLPSSFTALPPSMLSLPRTTCCWTSTAAWAPLVFPWQRLP